MKKTVCMILCLVILSSVMTACSLPELIGDAVIDAMGDVTADTGEDTDEDEETDESETVSRGDGEQTDLPESLPVVTERETEAVTEAETEAETEADAPYAPGFTVGQIYSSAWLGLRYMTPDDMTMCTRDEVEEILGESTDTATYEMMATDVASGASVILLTEKVSISGVSVKQYLNIVKTQYGEGVGSKLVREGFTKNIGGISFTGVEYDNAGGMSQVIYAAKKGNRFVVILVTYKDGETCDAVLAGFMSM